MGDYANEASRINDQIRQYKEAPIDSISDMAEEKSAGIQAKIKSRVAEYTDKWTHIKEMGDEELAGVAGIEVLKKGYKTAKGIYSKYLAAKDGAKKPVGEDGEGEEGSGEGGGASAGGEAAGEGGGASATSSSATATGDEAVFQRAAQIRASATEGVSSEASPFAYEGGLEGEDAVLTGARTTEITIASQAEGEAGGILSRAGSAIKGFVGRQIAKNTAEEASGEGIADAVGTGVAAAGEGASLGLAGAAAAIPVVGEGLLAVAGLVSLGEGIYHLFHHPHPKAPKGITPTNLALPQASTQLTNKYAMALPDIDTSQDRMASVASF